MFYRRMSALVRWWLAVHQPTMGKILRELRGVACQISHNGSADYSRAKAVARMPNASSALRNLSNRR